MKNKKESKRQTLLQCRGSSGSKEMWCFVQDASHLCVCLELCQRPACCIQQRCGCRRGGIAFWAGFFFFFFCPENRPWFPGTMQLMRASPRKIRLWHHGFLKHTAEPTLSCYNQVSVNFHCWLKLRERESPILKLYMVFLNTFFNLAANILELAPCSCTLHCIWLAVAIKLHTGLLVNFS